MPSLNIGKPESERLTNDTTYYTSVLNTIATVPSGKSNSTDTHKTLATHCPNSILRRISPKVNDSEAERTKYKFTYPCSDAPLLTQHPSVLREEDTHCSLKTHTHSVT